MYYQYNIYFPIFTVVCEPGWKRLNESCYSLITREHSWNASKQYCQTRNSNLVSIHSEMEMKFIKELVTGISKHIWIGGYETDGGAKWHWQDGSEFNWKNWEATQPNAPSQTDVIDDCAYIWAELDYQWGDAICEDFSFPFICMS